MSNNFLKCMDTIPQGVFIVATKKEETFNFMTAAFVTQISFHPCSIAVSVDRSHYTAELITKQGEFSLSVLAEGQELEAKYCGYQSGRMVDKAERMKYFVTQSGLPVIDGAAAYMICKVAKIVEYEDHVVFIAEILEGDVTEKASLIYQSSVYF